MDLQRFRERHPRWALFLHLRRDTAAETMRGYASVLMSLGSIGMFSVALYGLLLAFAVGTSARANGKPFLLLAGIDETALTHVAPATAVTIVLLLTASAFACFVLVRMLGKALVAGATPSTRISVRLRWLGHLLTLNLFASLFLPAWLNLQTGRFGFGFNAGFFPSLIGIYVCYALAAMVREGARAADENRGFV